MTTNATCAVLTETTGTQGRTVRRNPSRTAGSNSRYFHRVLTLPTRKGTAATAESSQETIFETYWRWIGGFDDEDPFYYRL